MTTESKVPTDATVSCCNQGHRQVTYVGKECPVCRVIKDFNDAMDEMVTALQKSGILPDGREQ